MIELLNIDCMEYMKTVPDKYFDLAIVDPPYGIGASKQSDKPNVAIQKNGKRLNVKHNKYAQLDWDFNRHGNEYIDTLIRVSKNQIVWGGNYYGIAGGAIVWDKINGNSDQYDCEIAIQSFDNSTRLVYFMWAGMFQGIYCGRDVKKAIVQQGNKSLNEDRIHPTQKPVKLYKWLLTNYTKTGDKILDTHLGSGSIAIACHDLGFDLVGCELDKDYYDAAVKRFNNHKLQTKLF
jgi:site-specific DNA-methyltransferase (adenine-specific)